MKAVSFDFDGTLDRPSVQEYAKELIERGIEVWICTFREAATDLNPAWNDDLYKVCDDINLPKKNVIFTNYFDKSNYLDEDKFLWHLDDDWNVCSDLKHNSKVLGISCFGNSAWRNKCERILNKELEKYES